VRRDDSYREYTNIVEHIELSEATAPSLSWPGSDIALEASRSSYIHAGDAWLTCDNRNPGNANTNEVFILIVEMRMRRRNESKPMPLPSIYQHAAATRKSKAGFLLLTYPWFRVSPKEAGASGRSRHNI